MWVDCRTASGMKMGTANFANDFSATAPPRGPSTGFIPTVVNVGLNTTHFNIMAEMCDFFFFILSITADIQFSLERTTRLSFKLPTESYARKQWLMLFLTS